ncbi:MAG: alpha/beta hydrolase [Oscillospiraceae bacterium]|nr:alpha/beta hydrolase [Oscillospiraceae bacterium]
MASLAGRIFSEIARAAGNVNPEIVEKKKKDIVKDLRSMEVLFRRYRAPRGHSYKKINVDGIETELFSKKKNPSDKVVLVIHGGAYISRMMFYYRLVNKRYSKAASGGTVIHYEYRCAPEHLYPAALEDTMKIWNWLLSQGYTEDNIITVGDSAGGHLSLNLFMKLHDTGRKQPKAAVLMSPWLDMTASGKSYVENYKNDPIFGIRGKTPSPDEVQKLLMSSGLYMWLGENDRKDPYISPVYAEFDNTYPPIYVTAGGYEMLLSDSETIVEKFKKAGVPAKLTVTPGMFHVFNLYEIFPESQRAIKDACKFIKETFSK